MDPQISRIVKDAIPKFNSKLAEGLACHDLKNIEKYISDAIKCTASSFPPGLIYKTYARATPAEEQQVATAVRWQQSTYELARSDVYLVKYIFEYNGEELSPRYIYLPYVHRGGIIHIRGVKNHISPVLADIGLSVEKDTIFVSAEKTRLIFKRLAHTFVANDTHTTATVVFSSIYHMNADAKARQLPSHKRNKAVSTLMHYVLCKYGLTETFKKFANTDIIIGGIDITKERYPEDKWVICRPTGYRPQLVRSSSYQPSELRIAIPKNDFVGPVVDMMGGVFYIVDNFPDRLQPDYLDYDSVWRVQLGHSIFKSGESPGQLQNYIDGHLRSIEEYIDDITSMKLKNSGIIVKDIYEFLIYIIETLPTSLQTAVPSSLYGKRLAVVDYIAGGIVKSINILSYALRSIKREVITASDIESVMNSRLKMDEILSCTKNNSYTTVVSSPGDCLPFKITNKMVPQTEATKGGDDKASICSDPSNFLHSSFAEIGSYGNMAKSMPIGKDKANPCMNTGPDNEVLRDPRFKDLLDKIQEDIERR